MSSVEVDQDIEWRERAVFVPAIMSVGLLFSLATLVRDAFRWTSGRARERRTAIEARTVVSELTSERAPSPEELGFLSRSSYLISAAVLFGGAAYVAIASGVNYTRTGGYVGELAWLLALAGALAVLLAFLGAVSLVLFVRWPHAPSWALGSLRTAPLTTTPGRGVSGPSWARTAWLLASIVFTVMITLFVASGQQFVASVDEPILDWIVETDWFDRLRALDPFGSTLISVAMVALIGLSAFRCRVMALLFPLAFAISWNTTMFLRDIVDRQRPTGVGFLTSYPSGHMVQAVFIAGLLPLALGVILSDRRFVIVSRTLLGGAVLATAFHRIHEQHHWPLDALGGMALGLTVVLGVHWVIEHQRWHARCSACEWSPDPHPVDWSEGVFTLSPRWLRRFELAGVLTAVCASITLLLATFVIGIPSDPEGDGFDPVIIEPVEVGFAVLIGLAGLLALRWKATAAVLMAFGAAMLGIAAAVEYEPYIAFGLSALLTVPAVFVWIAWQPTETLGSVARLALLTAAVLTTSGFGSREVYGHYFGPTHPESSQSALDSDASWLWLGAVDSDSATITAGGFSRHENAHLFYWPNGDPTAVRQVVAGVDTGGVVRFDVENLDAGAEYAYVVSEDELERFGTADRQSAVTFETFADGPQDLRVVLGACARRGSNGAVFDAMSAEEADLYLALGDLHYGNIESTDPADHLRELALSLGQPAQSSLFRSVPTAYVWDDHDFGANDADASSPGRDAVSEAYRIAVPHSGVSPDVADPISQAFTIGRVRFVMTDTRSHRTADSMLGEGQLKWLIDEITSSASSHAVVVWASATPWIADNGIDADDWSGYPVERQTIADAIAGAGVDNLVMVAGDAHMVAIDDGTNSDYSADGGGGFPVLHAAALDRPGSVKGGPYSEGAFPGSGQYGKLEIFDAGGDTVDVRLSGWNWEGVELVSWSSTFDVDPRVRG